MKPADADEVSELVEQLKRGELSPAEFMQKAAPDLDEAADKPERDKRESLGDERAGFALRKIRSL
jgi:hypothetical protein